MQILTYKKEKEVQFDKIALHSFVILKFVFSARLRENGISIFYFRPLKNHSTFFFLKTASSIFTLFLKQ